jgi:hypothetical protein
MLSSQNSMCITCQIGSWERAAFHPQSIVILDPNGSQDDSRPARR